MSDDRDEEMQRARFAAGGALSSASRRIEQAKRDLVFGPLAHFEIIRTQIARAEHDLVQAKAYLVTATHGLDVAAVQFGSKLMEGADGPSE